MEKKNKFSKLFNIKQLLTKDARNVLISMVISVVMEFLRQLITWAWINKESGQMPLIKDKAIAILFSSEIANVCLITIIVWCVTGICQLVISKTARKRSLFLTTAVFVGLISSLGWYIIEFLFTNSRNITFSLCAILFVLLLVYFSEHDIDIKNDTDNFIAPCPNSSNLKGD